MRPSISECFILASCVFITAIAVIVALGSPPAPPEPRLAYQRLEAPRYRVECRNHQFIVYAIDMHGNETEIDEGRFCDITDENTDQNVAP